LFVLRIPNLIVSAQHILQKSPFSSLGASRRSFDVAEENKVIGKQFKLAAIRESALPRLGFVIDFRKFLIDIDQSARQKAAGVSHVAYHDQRFLHAKDGVT